MSESNPFFSIVIPTYNRADLIKATLLSLKDQSFNDFEVIVIDDGGKDHTSKVVEDISDSRFQYLWKENEERAVARNTGALMARGTYINFFDSDDLAYQSHLREAHSFIVENSNPEVFHLAYDYKTPDGKVEKKIDNLPNTVNDLLANGNILSCNGVFVRKDIALKHPFIADRDLAATEDYVLWMQLAARYPFYNNNVVTSSILNHDSRSVIKIDAEKLIKRKELSIKYLFDDEMVLEKYGHKMRKMQADSYTYIALHLAIANHPISHSINYLSKAIKVKTSSLFERRFWGTIKTLVFR